MSPPNISKVTFNIPTAEIDALRDLAQRQGITVTTALRRAIGTEIFLAENESKGAKVLIEEYGGKMSRVIRK
jgi:hypothetical protein